MEEREEEMKRVKRERKKSPTTTANDSLDEIFLLSTSFFSLDNPDPLFQNACFFFFSFFLLHALRVK